MHLKKQMVLLTLQESAKGWLTDLSNGLLFN